MLQKSNTKRVKAYDTRYTNLHADEQGEDENGEAIPAADPQALVHLLCPLPLSSQQVPPPAPAVLAPFDPTKPINLTDTSATPLKDPNGNNVDPTAPKSAKKRKFARDDK